MWLYGLLWILKEYIRWWLKETVINVYLLDKDVWGRMFRNDYSITWLFCYRIKGLCTRSIDNNINIYTLVHTGRLAVNIYTRVRTGRLAINIHTRVRAGRLAVNIHTRVRTGRLTIHIEFHTRGYTGRLAVKHSYTYTYGSSSCKTFQTEFESKPLNPAWVTFHIHRWKVITFQIQYLETQNNRKTPFNILSRH